MLRPLLAALALGFLTLPAAAQAPDPRIADLIAEERALDIRCLGPEGALFHAPVCDQRQAVADELESLGWCYGRLAETGSRSHWHPCPPGAAATRQTRLQDLLANPPGTVWPSYTPSR